MHTCKSQKPENLCNNIYFLLFLAKKSKQKTLRLTKNAVLLLHRSGGAKKNSPNDRAEAEPHEFSLAQTLFGFIRLHSSKTCIFLRPVLPHLGTVLYLKFQNISPKIKVYGYRAMQFKTLRRRCISYRHCSITILPNTAILGLLAIKAPDLFTKNKAGIACTLNCVAKGPSKFPDSITCIGH